MPVEQPGNRARSRNDRRTLLKERIEAAINGSDERSARQVRFMGESVLKRADDELLNRHPAEGFVDHLRDALDAVAARRPGEIKTGCGKPTVEGQGYALPMYVLETCMADQPFIVDTIKLVLRRLKVRILGTLNMILPVERDADGAMIDISPDNPAAANESFTCHLLGNSSTRGRERLIRELVHHHLRCATLIVSDFRSMRRLVRDVDTALRFTGEALPERREAFDEVVAFGDWLIDDNFVFMGARRFGGDGEIKASLGLFRDEDAVQESDPAEAFADDAPLVTVRQTRVDSPAHRDARLQEIRIRGFDEEGKPAGGVVFQGLFTYNGLTAAASNVPVLRAHLQAMVEQEDLVPKSHRMKLFVAFFNRLPLTYTFAARNAEIRGLINEAIDVDFGGAARVHYFSYAHMAAAHVFVIVTADRFGDQLRGRVQDEITAAFGANHVEFRLLVGKTDASMWHFLLSAPDALQAPDIDELSARIGAIVSPWLERMRAMLYSCNAAETDIDRWCQLYGDALNDEYRQQTTPEDLLCDMRSFDRVHETGEEQLYIRNDGIGGSPDHARLVSHGPVDNSLTDILPVVGNFGLRVQGESTVAVHDTEGRTLYYEHYRIPLNSDQGALLRGREDSLLEALAAVLDGRMNSSTMNLILLPARVTWRQLQILRAYIGYARQVGTAFPPNLVQTVLHTNPAAVRALLDLFEARFAPKISGSDAALAADDAKRTELVASKRDGFFAELERVESAVEDKILRIFENLVTATLRTNYYQRPDDARALTFKLRCADIDIMRDPRPMVEIYVYDPDIEGVHLRGGPVARGGLRWSDRPDDFRTEILGLMLTQMVKNTLIVPVGSKGGFVLKKPIAEFAARRKRADELYEVFINGLLDLTDNIVNDKPVYPDDVVTYDGFDPYLVVAADKGTAHLSDTANGIAIKRGFWLGDAFASGGSQGYDHKVYGITAKGAWVCVQRLFRELGVDTQRDPFTCVGIGDMSGDVFGNGMLLSQSMRVVGAFNHMHIFIDPNPDAAGSFAERKRLFELPRSTWNDYDRTTISAGGGIWDRGAKSIPLSPQMQHLFGCKEQALSGQDMVRRLLALDCDLLWNGGIGTYVKASTETHAEVGDKANDGVRLDAGELRCRVVGEGGNLGLTHAARVEFSLAGGRITSDAVDNSGGVDLSDHEVNLKVLFAPLIAAGEADVKTRDELLLKIDDLVCEDVLGNNYRHALGISVSEALSPKTIESWNTVIVFLVEKLGINRKLQLLPTRETLKERRNAGIGLTRPEIARIVAFAKMWLFQELARDRECSGPVAREYLDQYFPAEVHEHFGAAIDNHKLRHEIICTVWCNEIVDFAGAQLMANLAVEYERPASDLCLAYSLAARMMRARELRAELQKLDGKLASDLQYQGLGEIERCVATATRALLSMCPGEKLHQAIARVDEAEQAAQGMLNALSKLTSRARRTALRGRAAQWQKLGLPREIARGLARLSELTWLFAVAELARRTQLSAAEATTVWFGVSENTGIGALLEHEQVPPRTRWEAAARASLRQDLVDSLLHLGAVVAAGRGDVPISAGAVGKVFKNGLGMTDVWALANKIPAERNPMAAMVVLTTRLRTQLSARGES